MPTVSVIVPTYNDWDGLQATLEALARQTLSPDQFEVVVGDNGSTDGTPDKIQSFAQAHPRMTIRVVVATKPGSYCARNVACGVAEGAYFFFTDAGCVPDSHWVESALKHLTELGSEYAVGPVFFDFVKSQPNVAECVDCQKYFRQEWHVIEGWGVTANAFVSRRAYQVVGGFREDVFSGADRLFGAECLRNGIRATFAKEAIVHHHARSTWKEVRKKVRRVAAGLAQRETNGTAKMLASLPTGSSEIPPKRTQTIPAPTLLQKPGILVLKALCAMDYRRVYRETLSKGKAELSLRS